MNEPEQPSEIVSQAAQAASESGGEPLLREGQMREPAVILGYVRALRRRKGTPEEKEAELFVKHSIRRAFAEWQQGTAKAPRLKKPTKQRVAIAQKRASKKAARSRKTASRRCQP